MANRILDTKTHTQADRMLMHITTNDYVRLYTEREKKPVARLPLDLLLMLLLLLFSLGMLCVRVMLVRVRIRA